MATFFYSQKRFYSVKQQIIQVLILALLCKDESRQNDPQCRKYESKALSLPCLFIPDFLLGLSALTFLPGKVPFLPLPSMV